MTPEDFTAAFPVFKDADEDVIASAIADSAAFFNDPDRYGDFLGAARNNLVAHFVFSRIPTGNAPDAGAGDVVSEDRGQTLKVTHSDALLQSQAVNPLSTTSWGRMFLYYQRLAGLGGGAAAGADCLYPLGAWGWSG